MDTKSRNFLESRCKTSVKKKKKFKLFQKKYGLRKLKFIETFRFELLIYIHGSVLVKDMQTPPPPLPQKEPSPYFGPNCCAMFRVDKGL